MKRTIFFLIIGAVLMFSCKGKQAERKTADAENDLMTFEVEGDSTVYGLVCDGCTDTILVFLPVSNIAADPDTFNVLNATKRGKVLGHLRVGDRIGIVRNATDSTVADCVVDLEDLSNTWCYKVTPKLRARADMEGTTQELPASLPDTLRKRLLEPMEFTMQLRSDRTAMVMGSFQRSRDEMMELVEYPKPKRYGQWTLFNGKLLLKETAFHPNDSTQTFSIDTAQFVMLGRDTLVLKLDNEIRSYYSKK